MLWIRLAGWGEVDSVLLWEPSRESEQLFFAPFPVSIFCMAVDKHGLNKGGSTCMILGNNNKNGFEAAFF